MPRTSSKNPVKKVSRTAMVKALKENGGKFFTSTHIDKNGNPNTMNAVMLKSQDSSLGYLRVWSLTDKGYRNINPQTLTHLNIAGRCMKA